MSIEFHFFYKGISVGHEKPAFNRFLHPIVNELKLLEHGVCLDIEGSLITKFFLLNAVFDKPARASVLNVKNAWGKYGCLKCTQSGVWSSSEFSTQ